MRAFQVMSALRSIGYGAREIAQLELFDGVYTEDSGDPFFAEPYIPILESDAGNDAVMSDLAYPSSWGLEGGIYTRVMHILKTGFDQRGKDVIQFFTAVERSLNAVRGVIGPTQILRCIQLFGEKLKEYKERENIDDEVSLRALDLLTSVANSLIESESKT